MIAEVSTVSTAWAVFSVIGGSIIGGAISTVVSFIVQRRSLDATKKQRDADRDEAKKQRDEDRKEVRKALGYSLFFKMIRIHSNLGIIDKSISESLQKANSSGVEGQLWQKVIPFGNLPDRVKFTSDEMALLLSLDNALFNDIGPYDDVHNSLLDQLNVYGQKRETIMEKFGATMSGSRGTTSLTKEQAEWLAPRAYELNSLAEGIVQRTEHDTREAKQLLIRLHALFVREFGLNSKLEF